MRAKLTQTGDEFIIRIPVRAGRENGLSAGQLVEISPRRPAPTLDDMLVEMDRLGPTHRPALVDWGPDVGTEIIDDDWSR